MGAKCCYHEVRTHIRVQRVSTYTVRTCKRTHMYSHHACMLAVIRTHVQREKRDDTREDKEREEKREKSAFLVILWVSQLSQLCQKTQFQFQEVVFLFHAMPVSDDTCFTKRLCHRVAVWGMGESIFVYYYIRVLYVRVRMCLSLSYIHAVF